MSDIVVNDIHVQCKGNETCIVRIDIINKNNRTTYHIMKDIKFYKIDEINDKITIGLCDSGVTSKIPLRSFTNPSQDYILPGESKTIDIVVPAILTIYKGEEGIKNLSIVKYEVKNAKAIEIVSRFSETAFRRIENQDMDATLRSLQEWGKPLNYTKTL